MTASLASYISLPGTTATAMEHWQDIFGGDLEILRYGDLPPMEGMPFTPDPNSVAHAALTLPNGTQIAGGDAMEDGTDYAVRGTAYSLLVTTDTVDEANEAIAAFVAGGGEIGMPFMLAPWGDWYGQVFDRFGVMWSFSCENGGAAPSA